MTKVEETEESMEILEGSSLFEEPRNTRKKSRKQTFPTKIREETLEETVENSRNTRNKTKKQSFYDDLTEKEFEDENNDLRQNQNLTSLPETRNTRKRSKDIEETTNKDDEINSKRPRFINF